MAKVIHPTSYHFGLDQDVIETNKFIYQVTLYKYYNKGVELLDNKYLVTTIPLKIIKNSKKINKKGYFCIEFINLIGVPKSFIEENDLKINEVKVKNKNK